MFRKVLVFCLILLTTATAFAGDTHTCALVMRAVAVNHAGFTPDDLRSYLASPPGSNPIEFASKLHPLKKMAFENGWRNARDGEGEAASRAEAGSLLARRTEDEGRRDESTRQTVHVPAPIRIKYLPEELASPNRAPGTPVEIDGNPHVAFSTQSNRLVVVDVDGNYREAAEPTRAMFYAGHPFQHEGKNYIAYGGSGMQIFDLATLSNVAPTLLGDSHRLLTKESRAIFGFPTKEGPRLLIGLDSPSGWGALALEKQVVFRDPITMTMNPNQAAMIVHNDRARLFALPPNAKGVIEVDTFQGGPLTHFPTKAEAVGARPFPNGEGLSVFLNSRGGLWILDTETQQEHPIVQNTKVWSMATVFQAANGKWYGTSIPTDGPNFLVVDLADRKIVREISGSGASTPMVPFSVDGRTYLTWGKGSGEVSLIDPFSGDAAVSAGVVENTPFSIVPMPRADGGVNALVLPFGKRPALIQLYGPLRAR